MKDPGRRHDILKLRLFMFLVFLLPAGFLRAGWTDSSQNIQGPSIGLFNGDWVSTGVAVPPDPAGLNTYYSYLIEVPPGTGELRIYIYDADIGAGTNLDLASSPPNTSVRYTIIDPTGSTASSITLPPGSCTGCDGAWAYLPPQSNPMVGHWELRIDQSTAVQSGGGPWNDINVLYVYAMDPVNGVELNLYSYSYSGIGNTTNGAGTVQYDFFPWVTCGCEVDSNDFDADTGNTATTVSISSRSGASSWAPPTSGATNWANNALGGFTTDTNALEYGIWHSVYQLRTTSSFPLNWATYYFGMWNAADPSTSSGPPTAQPEANTERIYYTTTAGGGGSAAVAPAKEYVEQMLTWVSGPNPPQAGRTTVTSVSIRVVNPTIYPIAFSSTNTVRAWVPGGGAVYGGAIQVSQGSIISQPAVGGTGAVVWNPGALAAGGTALMAYHVSVTPSSAGQRIPVTGSPGSNGTTATYVDGTCAGAGCSGAQLAGATFSFGELCELAVTENLLTHALISSFRLLDDGGEGIVEWETGSEAATRSFRLFLEDQQSGRKKDLGGRELPGLLSASQGGVYRCRVPLETGVYWIEEEEFSGRRLLHGPFVVKAPVPLRDGDGRWPEAGSYGRRAHALAVQDGGKGRRGIERSPAVSDREAAGRLAIGIRESGMYRVNASEIAAAMRIPEKKIRRLIRSGYLRLENRGRPVAWKSDDGRSILFFAEALDSIYSLENVYVLRPGRNRFTITAVDRSSQEISEIQTFLSSRHFEEDLLPVTALGLDPESDYWFWDYLLAEDPELDHRGFSFDLDNPRPGNAFLHILLQGASQTGETGHRAEVLLNGSSLGFVSFRDLEAGQADFSFDAGLLHPEGNTIEVYALPGAAFSLFFVDSFDVIYPRSLEMSSDALFIDAPAASTLTISSDRPSEIRVFDIGKPCRPVEIRGGVVPGGLSIRSLEGGRLLALLPDAFRTPSSMRSFPVEYPDHGGARCLILTPNSLKGAAGLLADYRSGQGMTADVVGIGEIMDRYNHSIFDPHAIRSFVEDLLQDPEEAPEYLLLLGKGTLDYRDLLGQGGNLMPPLMLRTESGLYASDGLYSDLDGDGIPEISTGRLPFSTAAEVEGWISRVRDYEGRSHPAFAMLVNDRRSGGGDFAADADHAASGLLPAFGIERLDLDHEEIGAARDNLFSALGSGVPLLQYFGHGGSDRLAEEGLLTLSDLDGSLDFGENPLVTALTCAVNRFELPGVESLGAKLLIPGSGGAIAVWAPSGLSSRGDVRELGRSFAAALRHPGNGRLGDVIADTMEMMESLDDPAGARLLFNLLGDPALKLVFEELEPPAGEIPDAVNGALLPAPQDDPAAPHGPGIPINPER